MFVWNLFKFNYNCQWWNHHHQRVLIAKSWSPFNIKHGRVFKYLKKSVSLTRRNDFTDIKECLVAKVNINNISCLRRSPSQNFETREQFCTKFGTFLSNITSFHSTCSIVLEDFTAKRIVHNITITCNYSEMIEKSTHSVKKPSSCIYLIFFANVSLTKTL